MKQWKEFFKNIGYSLNPWKYELFVERLATDLLKQFFMFLGFSIIISLVLFLPAFVALPVTLEEKLDGFDTLVIDINSSMNEPVSLPEHDPFISIDTTSNESNKDAFVSITGNAIYVGDTPRLVWQEYRDLLVKKATIGKVATVMLVLMAPSLLVLVFLYFAAKYLLIITLAALIGFIVARALSMAVAFKQLLKTGLIAATPMILIDAIRIPFALQLYALQYVVFGLFFTLGMFKVGSFAPHKSKKSKRPPKDEYVEIKQRVF